MEWETLYKPLLSKRLGELQWSILHEAVAVNSFISVLSPTVSRECVCGGLRERILHCFIDCSCLFSFLPRKS